LTTELVVKVAVLESSVVADEWVRFGIRAGLTSLSRDSGIVEVCDEGLQGLRDTDWGE
jgi:hypothetical protein